MKQARASSVIIGRLILGLADLFELLVPQLRQFGCELVKQSNPNSHQAKGTGHEQD